MIEAPKKRGPACLRDRIAFWIVSLAQLVAVNGWSIYRMDWVKVGLDPSFADRLDKKKTRQ